MLEVDLHTHTFFSKCGVHSHVEMLTRAKELGLKAIAVTDHGPKLEGRWPGVFCRRVNCDIVPGIRMLKGMESNLVDDKGAIDVPASLLPSFDVILLGIHPNTPKGLGAHAYTDMLIAAIEMNPCIDILTHTNDPVYTVEFEKLAKCAADHGVALELNNSKTLLGVANHEETVRLVRAAKGANCRLAVCSDSHALNELGLDSSVVPYLEQENFPGELVVTRSADAAFAFIDERRPNKQ